MMARPAMTPIATTAQNAERHPAACPSAVPKHVGERQPGERQRDRLRALLTRDEIAGDDRTDAEEGSMCERGQDPCRHQ
jgi:hypothetical protein